MSGRSPHRRPRLAYVVTTGVTARVLLRGQLSFLRESGFDITLIAAPGPDLDAVGDQEGVRVIGVSMKREPAPVRDMASLLAVGRALRRASPDIVNASTAKGGLLGMLAARTLSTPVRVYLLRGLRLETARGATRRVLEGTERACVACATEVFCVSPSLRRRYVDGGYCPAEKARVLASGSSNGVLVERFAPTSAVQSRARELRSELAIPQNAPVVGFVGRLVEDKGIRELLDAFERVKAVRRDCRLLLVGAGFAGDATDPVVAERIRGRVDVLATPHVSDLAPYYALIDVLAFPSYREGFPNVPLEAAAAGIPVVGFRATGTRDAIVDGETGVLVDLHDSRGLADGLLGYLTNPARRANHGAAGAARVRAEFSSERVWRAWRDEYERLLGGRPVPGAARREQAAC